MTEAAAVALTITTLSGERLSARALGQLLLLFALSAVYAEATDRIDRFRRFLGSDRAWTNTTSVWSFAAVLILPAGAAAILVAAVYLHSLIRSRRHQSARPHRLIYTAATMVLATLAAATVYDKLTPELPADRSQLAWGVILAIVCFHAVNQGLVAGVLYLATDAPSIRSVLITRNDLALEMATLVIGVMTAQTVLLNPWLTPLVLVLVAVLYRCALVEQLRVDATTDAKTGLLTPAAWRDLAESTLQRAAREHQPVGLLMIDLDHFKLINDTHGHLAGDRVLAAVARSLRHELRGYDAVGRFGGEEFAVLLDNIDVAKATTVAERLRTSIAEIGVVDARITVSVGVAHSLATARSLTELISDADAALYQAKALGRNRIHTALARVPPTSPALERRRRLLSGRPQREGRR
ncbi:MAG: GGDEF domain-containing protein [Actinomycetota bacterium]|nr:GGDEF domain-containing protein [Actinomycetota bacterium]